MSVVFHLIMTSNFRNSIGLSAYGRKKSHVPVYFLFRKSIAYTICNVHCIIHDIAEYC